ncbi:Formamidopyrimidine-DNA glycosylase N-terminal domain-containing protein [Microdochium trichocladiopsis]|uniref:Formamidopyrimidine-DNA glycosylase N-terminal domain-containing protein n=1 Tax=Microdochium trichocladiopsis TaxID=1682393 RepID=A0A9P8YH90_9PEZI|nr:Formamidopyrimidine-DNA glycosylase N-terminal domain-containing protein [Microdochium trichocladiopsis]KAH7040354.1 Formamidopyrimidine-DNA glycosylase N-terminal domain-containing protein [Microdochium trichocladiopsis]
MPEIAEVARVTHYLRQHLTGKTIGNVIAADDANVFGKVGTSGAEFERALKGRKVVTAGSQGKYFWLVMDQPPHPVMHLGMTGWVHIRGEQTAYTRYAERHKDGEEVWPPKYTKFQLETAGAPSVEVAFTDARRFSRIRLVNCPGADIRKHSPLVENGPDPVVDKDRFTEEYLRSKMKSRHVPIKALLLDQAMISGIGNWVGDEIMYQAKLHPEQYSDDFDDADITTLYNAVKYVCDTAVEKLGDSDQFPPDWLFNHRWGKGKKDSAKTLPNGEKLIFITVGGRTSCVVPGVQKKKGRTTLDSAGGTPVAKEEAKESHYFEDKKDIAEKPAKRARIAMTEKEGAKDSKKTPKVPKGSSEPIKKEKVKKEAVEEKSAGDVPALGRRRSTRLLSGV